jgi:GntR family transcriptional regulator
MRVIVIDRYSQVPIYEQVVRRIEQLILLGELSGGDMLPSVRTLSQELSVNPNTLQKAYAELEKRGICFSVAGTGRFILQDAADRLKERDAAVLGELKRLAARLKLLGTPYAEAEAALKEGYEGAREEGKV